jgi:hypothetical protein
MMRKSIPMLTPLSLSVSLKMALLTRRLEIPVILSLALADGLSSSGFTVSAFKANQNPPLLLCLRICPGRYMAFSSLWMSVAAILATLDINKSDETVLPEDGRYFEAGIGVL